MSNIESSHLHARPKTAYARWAGARTRHYRLYLTPQRAKTSKRPPSGDHFTMKWYVGSHFRISYRHSIKIPEISRNYPIIFRVPSARFFTNRKPRLIVPFFFCFITRDALVETLQNRAARLITGALFRTSTDKL